MTIFTQKPAFDFLALINQDQLYDSDTIGHGVQLLPCHRLSYAFKIVYHDDVIKWKLFPRNWPFVREIHRTPVDSHHKCQWHTALMFPLVCARTNG